jgi:hypothetical protein
MKVTGEFLLKKWTITWLIKVNKLHNYEEHKVEMWILVEPGVQKWILVESGVQNGQVEFKF